MIDEYVGKLLLFTGGGDAMFVCLGVNERNKINLFRVQDSKFVELRSVAFFAWIKDGLLEVI